MKTKNQLQNYARNELTFIATYKSVEDNRLDHYYSESLYRARDGSFVLQCFGNANSKHAKVEGEHRSQHIYYQDVDPFQWMIDHNHQRLAGMLFPNMRSKVEKNLHDLKLQSEILKDDEFYQFQFKNRQAKTDLIAICKESNAIVGHEELFWIEAEADGIIMLPGYEDYDDNNWDFFEKVQGNTFTGNYEIMFAVADGWTEVPDKYTHSAASVVSYYEMVKDWPEVDKSALNDDDFEK